MAELAISGRMTVKRLRSDFKKVYGLTLRVYDGTRGADEDATLASLARKKEKKVDDFSASPNMLVGNFEERFEKATGLKIQVASFDDRKLVDNSLTLTKAKEV
jgi:hypothetical protein